MKAFLLKLNFLFFVALFLVSPVLCSSQLPSNCTIYTNNQSIIDYYLTESKSIKDKDFVLIFSGKLFNSIITIIIIFLDGQSNFDKLKDFNHIVNSDKKHKVLLKYYCKENQIAFDVKNFTTHYVRISIVFINNGVVTKKENIKELSSKYLDFLFNKFNLRNYVENSLIQRI